VGLTPIAPLQRFGAGSFAIAFRATFCRVLTALRFAAVVEMIVMWCPITFDSVKELLLVEDCDADAALVERALDVLSVANPVRHVRTAEEAIAYLNRAAAVADIGPKPASILLLDLVLPGVSGLKVLEHMLRRAVFSNALRIVLSNLTHLRTVERAYSLGAHFFLTKPVQPANLQEVIETFPGYWSFKAKIENPFRKVPARPHR
jgi:CheY-like chemotaxis protein